MKTYEVYKEISHFIFDEIPENWSISKLKFLLSNDPFRSGPFGSALITSQLKDSGNILVYTPEHIAGKKIKQQAFIPLEREEELSKYLISDGDIVLPIVGTLGRAKLFNSNDKPGILNQRLCKITPNENKIKGEYLLLVLKEVPYIKTQLELEKKGAILDHITKDVIFNFNIPLPPITTQAKILNYLDHKTQIIDALIEKKEQLIKKLQAQRQAIINEAVTKGLNPNAKMKDSGIEWLGKIPEHWDVVKFRYKFETTKGLTITKANLLDEGVPCVNYGEIHSKYGFEVNPEVHQLKCVSEDYLETNENSLLRRGDFVFADTSEDIEGAGNFTHLDSDISTFAGYHTIIARLNDKSNYRFVAYFLDSIAYRTQIQNLVKGVKVYSITNKILKDTFLFFPPENEQEAIAQFIDNKVSKMFSSSKLLEKQIKKLKSYRQSIISEAVTGKVDVRDWEPKNI